MQSNEQDEYKSSPSEGGTHSFSFSDSFSNGYKTVQAAQPFGTGQFTNFHGPFDNSTAVKFASVPAPPNAFPGLQPELPFTQPPVDNPYDRVSVSDAPGAYPNASAESEESIQDSPVDPHSWASECFEFESLLDVYEAP